MMNFLLEKNGAMLANQKDKEGKTPLQLAEQKKGDRKIDLIIKSLNQFMDQQTSRVEVDCRKCTAKKPVNFHQVLSSENSLIFCWKFSD
jgi:ankyrin repeat protein